MSNETMARTVEAVERTAEQRRKAAEVAADHQVGSPAAEPK